MGPDDKVETALEAIQAVHGDASVSLEETLDRLRELAEEVQTLISAVEQDIRNAE